MRPDEISFLTTTGADPLGGGGKEAMAPPRGREVPQLIEGSETYQSEVKASLFPSRNVWSCPRSGCPPHPPVQIFWIRLCTMSHFWP